MAKLTTLAFLALLSLTAMREVTAMRATVTTTVVEEEGGDNPQDRQWCQDQIRQQRNLPNCQTYLSQESSCRYGDVAMVVEDGDHEINPQQEQSLSQCCRELGSINEQCRCQAVTHAFRQGRQRGRFMGTLRRAENLPSRCNLSPQRCSVELVWHKLATFGTKPN